MEDGGSSPPVGSRTDRYRVKKMDITFVDHNGNIIVEWNEFIERHHLPIKTYFGDIFNAYGEAVVSPANSFGFMDGGIDAVYLKRWPNIEEKVRKKIRNTQITGELLVGNAIVINTGAIIYDNLIVAPTMRIPGKINDPFNVYLATRAALRVADNFSIRSIVFPGMGTGIGNVDYRVAASYMTKAVRDYLNPPVIPETWKDAWSAEMELRVIS
jgi:O-acetyl-ADP-ribose deacetylase (regulator of RNase III)